MNRRRLYDWIMNIFMYFATGVILLFVILFVGYILYRGLPHITAKLMFSKPSLIRGQIGILPNIINTIYIIIMTLAAVLPIGVGSAIYLNEYAKNKRLVRFVELAAETLAGIPSIVYGLVGMLVFVQFFSLGTSLVAGAMTLVIMTLPTIMRTTQESLKTVPKGIREGSLALGSGKWYMLRTVVLPSVIDGIVTGCILSIGRIVGESAALLFTAGMANQIIEPWNMAMPNSPGSTLTVSLYMYAKERGEFEIAFAIAVILLGLTVLVNLAAKLFAKTLKGDR